jgi:hypothetical protein
VDFAGLNFPGISDPQLGLSERSYSYDPVGSLSQQSSHYEEVITDSTDNVNWMTPFGVYTPHVQTYAGQEPGNVELTKGGFFSEPGWWRAGYGSSNNWDDLRQAGVGYGVYSPHLEMNPVPAVKLIEPGSGFILPATFLGQPLVGRVSPPGT